MAGDVVYTVVPMPIVQEKMRAWGRLSAEIGQSGWYIRAIRHIDEQLRTVPDTWGDPSYNYRGARLRVYRATHENFIVYYAIHFDRPIVFFRNMELFVGSPLFRE